MADDVKTVTPTPGTTLYTGAGLHPFRPGEVASVPAETLPTTWLGRAWRSTSIRPHPRLRSDSVIDLDRYVLLPCMATWRRQSHTTARPTRRSCCLRCSTTSTARRPCRA